MASPRTTPHPHTTKLNFRTPLYKFCHVQNPPRYSKLAFSRPLRPLLGILEFLVAEPRTQKIIENWLEGIFWSREPKRNFKIARNHLL